MSTTIYRICINNKEHLRNKQLTKIFDEQTTFMNITKPPWSSCYLPTCWEGTFNVVFESLTSHKKSGHKEQNAVSEKKWTIVGLREK